MPGEPKPRHSCRYVVIGFLMLYLIALALFAVGTFGLFGSPRDPLAGVFLIPLGLPWNSLLDKAPGAAGVGIWIALFSPLVNLALLHLLCRWWSRRP